MGASAVHQLLVCYVGCDQDISAKKNSTQMKQHGN